MISFWTYGGGGEYQGIHTLYSFYLSHDGGTQLTWFNLTSYKFIYILTGYMNINLFYQTLPMFDLFINWSNGVSQGSVDIHCLKWWSNIDLNNIHKISVGTVVQCLEKIWHLCIHHRHTLEYVYPLFINLIFLGQKLDIRRSKQNLLLGFQKVHIATKLFVRIQKSH